MSTLLQAACLGLALNFWELLVGLPDEIAFIWRWPCGLNLIKALYILCRYFGLAVQSANIGLAHRISSLQPVPAPACRVWLSFQISSTYVLLNLVDVVLMTRIYAFYHRSWKVGFLLGIAFVTRFALAILMAIVYVPAMQFNGTCEFHMPKPVVLFFLAPEIISQSLILGLTFGKQILSSRNASLPQAPVVALLYRDGLFTYAAVVAGLTAVTIYAGVGSTKESKHFVYPTFLSILSTSACRIIINMQKLSRTFQSSESFQLTSIFESMQEQTDNAPEVSRDITRALVVISVIIQDCGSSADSLRETIFLVRNLNLESLRDWSRVSPPPSAILPFAVLVVIADGPFYCIIDTAFAFTLWDFLLTLQDEVDLIWSIPSRLSLIKSLFLFCRYLNLGVQLCDIVVARLIGTGVPVSHFKCRAWLLWQAVVTQMMLNVVDLILAIRTFAFYDRDRRVGWVLATALLARIGMSTFGAVVVIPSQTFDEECNMTASTATVPIFAIIEITVQTLIIGLTFSKQFLAIQHTWIRSSITSLVYRDGMIILLVGVLLNSEPELLNDSSHIIFPVFIALLSSVGCRMIINMLRVAKPGLPQCEDSVPSFTAEITTVLDSIFSAESNPIHSQDEES
ncbi:hypothetical protein NP233_g6873 [Leucocoprinus birnbaumii]|uniref:DUF6533 domain-containing protein n=1 Tax=Leucocoprinus birnbaumii TaxID=56174 RepID=A0AAD5VQF6_9AGAR|nr:hypothetical protein NP233_g6873 [Leucocoprinus birnbaumii]